MPAVGFVFSDAASGGIVLFCCHLATHSASLTVNQLSFNVEGVLRRWGNNKQKESSARPANGTISFHLKGQYSARLFK